MSYDLCGPRGSLRFREGQAGRGVLRPTGHLAPAAEKPQTVEAMVVGGNSAQIARRAAEPSEGRNRSWPLSSAPVFGRDLPARMLATGNHA
jgi:hypothetical protein